MADAVRPSLITENLVLPEPGRQPNQWLRCPERPYRTINRPRQMRAQTSWPIPAPEVIREALESPLQGMWIDHVPTGAELAAVGLLCTDQNGDAWSDPLVTGAWENYGYPVWAEPHPEELTPQMVMPDAWFDNEEARTAPPPLEWYEPEHGRTVRMIIGLSLSGSGEKEAVLELPAMWRRGLLRSARERSLANHLLRNASPISWYRIVLDEGWTMRRAAEVLREACIARGDICQMTNRGAKRPAKTQTVETTEAETPVEIMRRCRKQGTKDGRWPLGSTEEIARGRNYERVE